MKSGGKDENLENPERMMDPSTGNGTSREESQNNATSSSLTHEATGPRTQEGKEKSKHNATTHGIFSKVVVIKGESRAKFEDLLNGLRNYFQPEGTLEDILVEKLAALFWRERRLIIADGEANIGNAISPLRLIAPPDWDLLLRYGPTLDRAIDCTLSQLERAQRMRLGQPVPPRIDVSVSSP